MNVMDGLSLGSGRIAHSQRANIPTRCPGWVTTDKTHIEQNESASLIGHLGSSAFRLSTISVSMSLTGSCFSSESAPRPVHHGIRGQGGTILATALPRVRQGPSGLTNSPHPSSREGHHSTARWSSSFLLDCCPRGLFSDPAELSAVNPYAVQDHSQTTGQGEIAFFIPRAWRSASPKP